MGLHASLGPNQEFLQLLDLPPHLEEIRNGRTFSNPTSYVQINTMMSTLSFFQILDFYNTRGIRLMGVARWSEGSTAQN